MHYGAAHLWSMQNGAPPHLWFMHYGNPPHLWSMHFGAPTHLWFMHYGDPPHLWFMHYGTPPHSPFAVREYLNTLFLEQWIARSGTTTWPTHSPDMNALYSYL
jgi:hypothetical protein